MNNKGTKILLFLLMPVSIPVFAQDTLKNSSLDKIECGIHDCTLECLSDGKRSTSYGGARSITTEFLSGGIIRYTVEKGINGRQIVLVGPNSYICSVNKS